MDDVAVIPRRKRPWVIIGVVGAVVAVGLVALFFPRAPEKPKITTQHVDRGDIVVRVTATGTLSALVTVQVGSQVSGRISEINVDFNTPVKKGAIIARIDPQLLNAAVTEAKANNAAAVAALDRARVRADDAARQRDRARELAQKALIAPADLDAAELAAKVAVADVGSAQAQLEQARSSLERAQINLGYATIYSPIDGVVISRNVDVGQTVAASLQAPTLFTIAQDLAKMQVDTSVGEADIGKITPGMDATFTVDAWPSERFSGTVRQIRNAPQTVQNVVSYDVIIDVDNSDGKLRPGMTANATFVVETKGDVLRVPNAALRFRPPRSFTGATAEKGARAAESKPPAPAAHAPEGKAPEGKAPEGKAQAPAAPVDEKPEGKPEGKRKGGADNARELWVMRAGKPAAVKVHTGLSDGTLTEIVDGDIHEGDEVVTDAVDVGSGGDGNGGGSGGGRLPRRMF